MSLRFIYGRAGSGKSHFCFSDIKKKIENNHKGLLMLLVPEDFSFQAEKRLLSAVGEKGLMQARVLSFKRMAHAVFGEVGGLTRRYMNGAGRSMLLYRIMDEVKDELSILSKSSKLPGFINTMSDMITELKVYGISPESLVDASTNIGDLQLKAKIKDIGLIYSKFENSLSSGYIDPDDDLSILYQKMDKSRMFDGCEVWVDGFSVFTPQQYRVMEKLLKKADRVNVTLCSDGCDSGQITKTDIFSCIRDVEKRLLKIAMDNNIPYEKPVNLNNGPPFRFLNHPELHHLERNVYTYPHEIYKEKTVHINLYNASNRYLEVEDTARDIIRLCRDLNYRYSDIAVITSDVESYEKLVSAIFKQYGIPTFVDKKRDITGNPLVVLIMSALEILNKNWTYESVFRYLKAGLLDIDDEDMDILENYVLASGIKGKRWTDISPWQYWPDYGYEGELPDDVKERLDRINKIREAVSAPLIAFNEALKKSVKAMDMAAALFDFMESINVYDRLQNIIDEFEKEGNHDGSGEFGKVWNMVIDTLDQIVEVLGDQTMTLDAFSKVLSIGFSECRVGLIPPTLDQVMFGSIERIKSHSVKALYILGVNDGSFPVVQKEHGVLNDSDRQLLKECGLELAPCIRDSAYDGYFMVYTAFARTDSYLRISCPMSDHEGKSMRSSSVIKMLKKIFPNITEYSNFYESDDDEYSIRCINSPNPTFISLVESIRKSSDGMAVNPIWQDVYKWYAGNISWKLRMDMVSKGIGYKNQVDRIDEDRVKSLYGRQLRLSISRLERFARCPFSYFLQYGLKAKDRKIYELSAPDLGSFMHRILDGFSNHLDSIHKSWRDLEKDECRAMVSMIVDKTVDSMSGSILTSSARHRYLKERLKRIMHRSIWLIAQHIKKGRFEPLGHEVSFEKDGKYPPIALKLPDGTLVSLSGRIDRVDIFEGEEGKYVRIVDYKSGNKSFSLSDIYSGIELQLLIYLDAVLEHMEKISQKPVFPGGILYFKIYDPMIEANGEISEEEVEMEITKSLKMNGLLLSDVKVVKEMDRDIKRWSLIIPVEILKDDKFGEKSSIASKEDFTNLRKHVKDKIIGLCQDMLGGNIEISPLKNGNFTSCSYCSFKPVCMFDSNMEGNSYRKIVKLKKDEVWEALKKGNLVEGGKM